MRVIAAVMKGCSVVTYIETKALVYRVHNERYALQVHEGGQAFLLERGAADKEENLEDDIEGDILSRKEVEIDLSEFYKLLRQKLLRSAMIHLTNLFHKILPR